MKYIFHISDIHIDVDRNENLQNSFEKLIIDIIEHGVTESLLVIVGDIFENKTILSSDDICIFDKMMSVLYNKKIRTLIVVGNHDFNINVIENKTIQYDIANDPNKIVLEILTERFPNITCLTYTQVYVIDDIEFYVYSIVDNRIPTDTRIKKIKIALLHDGVNGGKYDNGQVIKGMKYNICDFNQYDYTLLGDIHKPQFLTDTMAYCGSFIQKNKGEGIDHGYILWDLVDGTGIHKFIPLKNVMIKIYASDDNNTTMPVLLDYQKVIYVQLWYRQCSELFIETLCEKIKKTYGMLDKIVNKDIYNICDDQNSSQIPEFKNVNHDSCIRELLKGRDECEILKMIEHHTMELQNMKDVNHTKYTINYLSWSNILCYGENNYIDFRKLDKLVVLNGKNKYGKSSVIDILIRILFNECERGYKKDIVNKNKQSGCIKLSLSIRSGIEDENPVFDEYIIEQVIYKTVSIHRLYKNGNNITKQTIVDTYRYLNEKIGIGSYKDFINMTTALQNRKFLVDMKEDEMLDMIIKLLNIEILDHINSKTKSRQKLLIHENKIYNEKMKRLSDEIGENKMEELKKEYTILGEHINKIKTKIANGHVILQELNKQYDSNIGDLNIDEITSQIESLEKYLNGFEPDGNDYEKMIIDTNTKKAVLINILGDVYCKENSLDNIKKIENPNITDDEYEKIKKECEIMKLNISKPKQIETDKKKYDACKKYVAENNIDKKSIDELYKKIKHIDDVPENISDIEIKITDAEKSITEHKKVSSTEHAIIPDMGDCVKIEYNISSDLYDKLKNSMSANHEPINVDELDEKIKALERVVFIKKKLIPLEIQSTILDKESIYEKIIHRGLPDFNELKKEKNTLTEKIRNFDENYGELEFNLSCECCNKNKSVLDKFNIDDEKKRVLEIENILVDEIKRTNNFNKATKFLAIIEKYKIGKKLNCDIKNNNDMFDKLQSLKDYKNMREYERIFIHNKKIESAMELTRLISTLDTLKKTMQRQKNNDSIESANKVFRDEIIKLDHGLECINNSNEFINNFDMSKKYLDDSKKIQIMTDRINQKNAYEKYLASKKLRNLYILHAKFEKLMKKTADYKKLSQLKSLIMALIANNTISKSVQITNDNICTLETEMSLHIEKKENLTYQISTISEKKSQLDELTTNMSVSTTELTFLNTYQKCVDKKTGISQKILGELCDIMTLECNKILNEIAEFTISIVIENKILRIYTFEKGIKIPASMASGYQKFVMDMILRIVLTTCLTQSNNISNPNILILDEGFGCLDKENFVEVAKILKTLKNKFRYILIITHIDELKSYADQLININRVNGSSKLTFGGEYESKNMMKMRLSEELAHKSSELEDSRTKINEEQTATRAKKEALKQEKVNAKKKKETIKKNKEDQKSLLQAKHILLTEIIGSNDSIKEKIIEFYTTDTDIPMFKCKACNKTYMSTETRINNHVSSTTYQVKHKKYIKTLL